MIADSGELLASLALHLVLIALPGAAAALWAARRWTENVPLLLAVGLAGSGLAAYLGFWAFYADPLLGETYAYLLALGSAALCAWALVEGVDRALLRRLAVPVGLWALASVFVLFLGFVHGGLEEPLVMATTRFSHPLPADNYIPLFYAEWFFEQGHSGQPPEFPGGWLSSDRPPLQSGYALSQHVFGWDAEGVRYEALSVGLQQLWVIALWALLTAAGIGRSLRAMAMAAALFSDIAIVHGFFVWPKLLAATFVLAALAVVLSPAWAEWRRDLRVAALVALLCGLAMLAHGASVFGIVPLALVAARRGLPSWRWIGVGAAVGLVILGSWSAYQRYGDPPGDRLLKWQLAGVTYHGDERGAMEAIVDSYREAGIGGTIDNKSQNFAEMAGWYSFDDGVEDTVDFLGEGELGQAVATVRAVRFFGLLPFLGIFLVAPFAMLAARRRADRAGPEWRLAVALLLFAAVGAVAWGLLIFGADARTVIHAGSLAIPLAAVVGCVVGAHAVVPRLALALVALSSLLALVLYVPVLDPLPETEVSLPAALLSLCGAAGFVGLAARADDDAPAV